MRIPSSDQKLRRDEWLPETLVFGTDSSGKHLHPKVRMPKQIRVEDCSAVLCIEFRTCLKFLKE